MKVNDRKHTRFDGIQDSTAGCTAIHSKGTKGKEFVQLTIPCGRDSPLTAWSRSLRPSLSP